jgi:8-oxo-dGTP pyrophosphatase MutT (NUDIX family)
MSGKADKKGTAQFAALPWRRTPEGVSILLITSRETRRWLIPKGWPMKHKTPAEAAAQEAYEEAGVIGVIGHEPLGFYGYAKQLTRSKAIDVEVTVFGMEVLVERQDWPERDEREKHWFTPDEAATLVDEPALQDLIRAFGQGG